MYFAIPGDVIGALVMLKANANYPVSAIAMGPSTVILLSRAVYREAWMSSATVQTKLNSMLYSRMSLLQDEKANVKLPLQQRVASLLIKMLDRYPQTGDAKLPIPLTRQEIADAVGASVESVIRCMSEMSQAGIIKTEDKQIEILKTDSIIELLKGE
jgi:CRP/FNR family transcriptional regulator